MVRKKENREVKVKKIVITVLMFLVFVGGSYYSLHKTVYKKLADEKVSSNNSSEKDSNNEKNTIDKKEPVQTEVLLSSAGDCTIGHDTNFGYANSLPAVLNQKGNDYSYFFKNVAEIFKEDNITTVNLETTFTNATVKAEKQFNFKAPPEYAKSLPLGNIEAVNLSNNHIYDYLDKGFKDTIAAVKAEGINYFGEGNKWLTEVNGNKMAFLGYRGFSSDEAFLKKVKGDIEELKSKGYTVVINFHWGQENSYYPSEGQKQIAHYAIDQGADLIVGHHPHVIQGIEKYKNKIIAYSLGNFAFGGNMNPRDKDTFILQTKFVFKDNNLVSYGIKVIPCSISSVSYVNDYCPTPLKGNREQEVLAKLNKISMNLDFELKNDFVFLQH
ncbi:CapA family protein [Clostridium sp. A1-XYC3]|uniref:CapA family protein n=1 Tax=Clostridium tanneri TaxID=3037988 RepID=A0ABU4JQT8_9CLOT|nr:CapA family protein [Clostridium sp. A1-XYC3]MDW8800461.1 CapA family protein [Clostridium sp. A1-XYC3]